MRNEVDENMKNQMETPCVCGVGGSELVQGFRFVKISLKG